MDMARDRPGQPGHPAIAVALAVGARNHGQCEGAYNEDGRLA
jgi:hypothetical protein